MKETLTIIDSFKSKHIGKLEVSFLITKKETQIRILNLATGVIESKSFNKESLDNLKINAVQNWFEEIEKKIK